MVAFDAVPDGFQSAKSFAAKFASRPGISSRLPAARARLEADRAARDGYAVDLAGLRRMAGLSQSELAAIVGTHQPNISAYESGEREPSLKIIRALAGALGVGFDVLLPALK
jgi:DNA-binding XRE family transcriptional regulator